MALRDEKSFSSRPITQVIQIIKDEVRLYFQPIVTIYYYIRGIF